jgi:hypothetical protein
LTGEESDKHCGNSVKVDLQEATAHLDNGSFLFSFFISILLFPASGELQKTGKKFRVSSQFENTSLQPLDTSGILALRQKMEAKRLDI